MDGSIRNTDLTHTHTHTPPPPPPLYPLKPPHSCFVEAADTNEALLTVRETLLFAGACTLPVPSREAVESPYFQVCENGGCGFSVD